MQTDIAESIYKKAKVLPIESQKEILSFIDEMQTKSEENGKTSESGLEKLWREIDDIVASVSKEAWDEIPADGAINVDHYLYGAPKRRK